MTARRILLDGTCFPDAGDNGASRYLRVLVEALGASVDDDRYVIFGFRDDPFENLPPAFSYRRIDKHESLGPAAREFGRRRFLTDYVRREKADIVHFILDGALVPKTVASVFTFFDIARTHPAYRRSVASSPLRAAVRTWMRHRAVRRADVVVTTSETAKRDIAAGLQIDPSRIAVAPIAPARIFTPGTSDPTVLDRCGVGRRPYLLFVGQFGRQKNEDALLEALRGVPETCLVLVGDPGDLADATKKRCADEALAGRVFFAGRVTDDDLCSLYRGATALCLPSHYEGYGLPAVEAMACGTPVVVSDGGALPEIVGAAGIVAPLSNRHALRDALLAVTRDAAIRERLRAAGLERAREFGHDAMAERHREIYRHALAR